MKKMKKGLDKWGTPCYDDVTEGNQPTVTTEKEVNTMTMSEAARIIIGLRAAGWPEKDINDFILWIETGEEQYKPKDKE